MSQTDLKSEDAPKIEDDLKNEDIPINEDDTKNHDDSKNEDEDFCCINYPERVILYGRGICRFAQFFNNIILLD